MFTQDSLSRIPSTFLFSSFPSAFLSLASAPKPPSRPPTLTRGPIPGTSGSQLAPGQPRLPMQPPRRFLAPRLQPLASILRNLRPVPRDDVSIIGATSRPPPSLVRPIAPIPRPDGSGPAHQAGQVLLTARKFQQYGDQREGYALPPPPGLKIRQEFVPQVQERLLQLAVRARAEASEQNRPMPDIIQFSVDRNFFTSA